MKRTILIAFQLTALLLAFQVNSVPTRHHDAEELHQQMKKPLRSVPNRQDAADTIGEKGDMLDRILSRQSKSKQSETVPYNEEGEFWKYIGKDTRTYFRDILKSKFLHKQIRSGSLERQFEILKPFLPPYNIMIPPDSFYPGTPEPEELETESSPEATSYLVPSPSMTPEEEYLAYPSYSPLPEGGSRPTFPSLATVDNERGEIIYRPWDSFYVVVRRFFKMDEPEKNVQ